MIRELKQPDATWEAMLGLFRSEFPPSTREPDEQLWAEIEGRWPVRFRYWIWEESERVGGFIRAAHLPETSAWFIIHVATAPDRRGTGIGHALLDQIIREAKGLPILCEVEPGPAMQWWSNRGARTISTTYTQPALRPDNEPVPFHLMAIGTVTDPTTMIPSFYREAWNIPAEHPFVIRTLSGVVA